MIVPLLQLLQMRPEEVLIESTGVIGHRIKKVKKKICMFLCFTCDAGDRNLYDTFLCSIFPFLLSFLTIHSSDYRINSYAGRSSQFPSKAC